MMSLVPHEFVIGGVYFPPLFISWCLAVAVTMLTAKWLNRKGLAQYFFYTPLVFIALNVIYTVLFSIFIIPG